MKIMTHDAYRLYMQEAISAIKERALEAREERPDKEKDAPGHLFQSGRVLAFNEVVSILQQLAETFQIGLDEIHLDDIDPDRDLI